jgi:hypothetical protein
MFFIKHEINIDLPTSLSALIYTLQSEKLNRGDDDDIL